jgi:diadenosine tetraphosphatase ApaH/serine/threonine PP2A family protein phosphatase
MQLLTRKHLSRREVIRGAGSALALPLLDAMIPAQARGYAAPASATRLCCIEMVHGAAGSTGQGTNKHYWSPELEGRDFQFSHCLEPLAPLRDSITIISNTDLHPATAYSPAEEGADHYRSSAVYLTAAHPKMTESSDYLSGTSLDQLYAQQVGKETPLPSVQLCIESVEASGACDFGYACVYADTISWASPTTPLPMTLDPRTAFETLFGDGSTPAERRAHEQTDRSILDWISQDAARLRTKLGPADRSRLDSYLDNVREIESRIQRIEKYNAAGGPRELPDAPLGVPDSYEEHVKLMFDLQLLAFMTETTRVATFKMSRDVSERVFPESGVKTPFHPLSHHGEHPDKVEEFARLNRYHVSLAAYFLDKLKNTPDGDGNLLDHSMILYGSPMGDSNVHNHKRVPIFLAGHANGALKGGLHLRCPDETPMANVLLTMLRKLGANAESFGDSTGELAI